MNPRFDVFRKQNERLLKWIGTAESLEHSEKLIRSASISNNTPEDDYIIVRLDYGGTEAFTKLVSEREPRITAERLDGAT